MCCKSQALQFNAPVPPECPDVQWYDLSAGDCLLLHGTQYVGRTIEEITNSPWSHAAMVVVDPETKQKYVAEMTWPRCRMTPLKEWLAKNGPVWVVRLLIEITSELSDRLYAFWQDKVGKAYDIALLFALAPATWWQRLSTWIGLPVWLRKIQPIAGNGVCSVVVAWAWKAIGLPCDETTGMTPGDIVGQSFVRPLERVVLP